MMAFRNSSSVFVLGFVLLILGVVEAAVAPSHPIHIVRRSSFPKGFVFGSSSSAYQYEGAAFKYGKGLSIWDIYTHQHSDRIKNHSNGDVAVDSYHRYKEDVAIMKRIGFDVYRFSIAWTRILPKGKLSGGVNKEGIEYYNNLINELLANGITPYITLFHWDVPQVLQDEYQGFMGHQIKNDFRDYVELCFKEFGDRVKHWITMNEQYIFSLVGYAMGINAPGRCSSWQPNNCLGGDSGTEPYIVGHNQILAHAAAVKVYKTKYQAHQKGVIGITLASDWYIPYSDNNEADKEATSRALDFSLGWFLHPIVYGDYPPIMRTLVKERLPNFTREEIILITESFDFIGMNYYSASYAKDDPNPVGANSSYLTDYRAILTTERNETYNGSAKVNASSSVAIYPQGLYDLLMHIKTKYKNPMIVITENGYKDIDNPKVHELIKDKDRVKYLHDHLLKLHKAIKAGVRVKGYCVWSLFDNFEWANGYTLRYGIVYIDFKHQLKRILKDSANWFHNFLST